VQRGIDYIEAHLDDYIDTADVARHAGVSHWHFQRMFKALTNETLKTYIRARRFASSLERLAGTTTRILEIALTSGFESQESFTRAFKNAFGVTPAQFRKRSKSSPFLRKVRIDADYLTHIHTNVSLEPHVELRPAMRVVGLRTSFFGVGSEKNNLAKKLPPLWAAFLPRLSELVERPEGPCFGVLRQTPGQGEELDYVAGVAVSPSAPIPSGMVSLEVAPARYAIFEHRGDVAALDDTVNYIYSTWLHRSGLRHTYGCDLELYDERYVQNSADSVIYYGIPVASS
jgi:AraC family transcriptional regulator